MVIGFKEMIWFYSWIPKERVRIWKAAVFLSVYFQDSNLWNNAQCQALVGI